MNSFFKTYDIRGVYPNEINEETFYKIARALSKLGINEIVIGRDARISSDSLFNAFFSGLKDSGVNVIDLGVVTSPMLSFFSVKKRVFGAMITASHNPREYNGIKFIDKKGIQLSYDPFLKKLENIFNKLNKKEVSKYPKRKKRTFNSLELYSSHIRKKFSNENLSNVKVVFDCSNGVASIPLVSIIKKLGIKARIINQIPDGNFPNHSPDQTKTENLKQLQDSVIKSASDLGIMFDGDSDRCAFVDEKGNIIPIDLAFLVLALNEIKNSKLKKPKILYDLRFSRIVEEKIKESNALPVIMKVGNPFYKLALQKQKNSIMAGELSGHIMYKENFGIDDPIFATLKMIEIISNSSESFSEIISKYKKYYSTGEISFHVKDREAALSKISNKYSSEKKLNIDGITVIKDSVWFNVRPSNTESLIRIIIEGTSIEEVKIQREEIESLIK